MKLRVGQGFDVHAFGAGDHVTLGGVRIPFEKGLVAHSDGDVLLHAACDALLGAASLGDIGSHFPPSDATWADADSRDLLRAVAVLISDAGWTIQNLDVTVVCERPRMGSHVAEMRANLATDLGIGQDQVSVKATTTERLGFCGREEGIAATAVALLSGFTSVGGEPR